MASPSPSQSPTSRDTDGNVTKKSAQESERSSCQTQSHEIDTSPKIESVGLAPAFERARALIEGKTGGALVISYSLKEIEDLVRWRNYDRDFDAEFMTALSKALVGHGNPAKAMFMHLVRDGDAEGEKMWSQAENATRSDRQKAVHKLMEWIAEDNAVEFERWMDRCVPLVVVDNINDGIRGLAQIAHFYLER